MSKTLRVMWVGISLLVASWMFPPSDVWMAKTNYPAYHPTHYGFTFFLLDMGKPEYAKLAVIDAAIIAITAGAMITTAKRR